MTKIEKLTKKRVEVETMLWDGTDESADAIREWVGRRFDGPSVFMVPSELHGTSLHAQLWVAHNDSWTPLPVGYRVARELDGSGFYPLSPEGRRDGYETREPQSAHSEAYCHRCHGPNITWSAPSPLWNQVMRGGSIGGEEEFHTLQELERLHGYKIDAILPDGTHRYWSTHCRHNDHQACSADTIKGINRYGRGRPAWIGRKPAQCKTCAAPCVCPCHSGADAP